MGSYHLYKWAHLVPASFLSFRSFSSGVNLKKIFSLAMFHYGLIFAPLKGSMETQQRVSKMTVLCNSCNSSVSCWFSQNYPQCSNFTAENDDLNYALHFAARILRETELINHFDNRFLHSINHHPSQTIFPPRVMSTPD